MAMYDIIYKKREGGKLTAEEINYFIEGYTKGEIPDYQAAALLMAIFFRNITEEEAFLFTDAMKNSGETVDLSEISGIKVDKHSTGGVGDKTTLIVGPLAAACGVPIAKMSGRGLGFTGGTIDKLEAIPGFETSISIKQFKETVKTIGISIIGQMANIAAADKKLYALRDVTATVDNMGMITASVMSKKLAAGSDAIVLDVKCGKGAFMKDENMAVELGRWMADIGKTAGKKMAVFITDMNEPLGFAVGNSLEVIEAIETLKGKGPDDITELSLQITAGMIYLGEKAATPDEAYKLAKKKLYNGEGLSKFEALIKAQGGNARVIDDYNLLPKAACMKRVEASKSGFINLIDAQEIGRASQLSGAGRVKKEDNIDLSAGIVLKAKIGTQVREGETIAVIYGNDLSKVNDAATCVEAAIIISNNKPIRPVLIHKIQY